MNENDSDNLTGDEIIDQEQSNEAELAHIELDDMKRRADTLGITYHPSIGIEKLALKIREYNEREDALQAEKALEQRNAPAAASVDPVNEKRLQQRNEALALVHCRITCMNPAKREYEGQIFQVGNSIIPTVKKYVHFGVEWHVPRILLNVIQNAQYQTFVTQKVGQGKGSKRGRLVKEFAVEILPDLTEAELRALSQRQLSARGTAEAAA